MKQAERRKFHYIYKITRFDGKYYIGMHSTDDLEDGYFGSGQLLWKSIKKHGKEKHSKEILEFLPSRSELKTREREIVNEEIVNDPLCMNLQLGGGGGWGGHPNSLTALDSGRTTAAAIKRNVGLWSAHHEVMKNAAQVGLGVMNSAEANAKRKTTFAKRGHMQGESNSQFGTCWVIKEDRPIKINKHDLEEYLAIGFQRGRKMRP